MKYNFIVFIISCLMICACSGGKQSGQALYPTLECDSAVVNITFSGFDSDSVNYLDAVSCSFTNVSDLPPAKADRNDTITYRLNLMGDAVILMLNPANDGRYGLIRVAPGEITDVTIYPDSIVTTGRFAQYNSVISNYKRKYEIDVFDHELYRYDMTGDQYTETIIDLYNQKKEALDADTDLTDAQRVYEQASLINSLLRLASDRSFASRYSYIKTHPGCQDVPNDSLNTDMSEENYKTVMDVLDLNDESMLMATSPNVATSLGKVDWNSYGADGTLLGTIQTYQEAMKKANEAKVDSTLIKKLRQYPEQFFADAVEVQAAEAQARIEAAAKLIEPTPDVPSDQIIEAIATKYPGKIVLIDRWNTWCSPCKAGIAKTEPLKKNLLSNPDIEWIYIADETSPRPDYYKMISTIKGHHYYITAEQANALYKRYNISGIPFYFLVNRDGTIEPHPDFRDHSLMINTILSKVKNK